MRENKNQNENQNEIVNENFNDIAKNNSKINKSISNMKRIILLIEIILSLIAIQCFRIALKKIVFTYFERTLFTDVIFSMSFMLILSIIAIIVIKTKKLDLNLIPKKFSKGYIITTFLLIIFLIITPIITLSVNMQSILSLIYGAIITVIFEEIIFRGFIYKYIEEAYSSIVAYILSTLFFAIWNLGYIDTIIWRTSIFSPNANIPKIMLMKVLTGFILGLIFGVFRYKKKNTYASMLVHSFINGFGS